MKVLILSDVHANLAALEAVLDAEPSFDRLLFLGDAVDYGPDPSECLRLLRVAGAVAVRGNHDNAVAFGVECRCSEAFGELSRASRAYTRSVLAPEEMAALRVLPLDRTLDLGDHRLYLTHASPSDNLFGYVSPEADEERWRAEMALVPDGCDIILTGHTHRPYVRSLGDRVVVNPGSVGQPRDGDPRAAYAVWDGRRFDLRRVGYDVERTAERLRRTPLAPEAAAALAAILRRGGAPPTPQPVLGG